MSLPNQSCLGWPCWTQQATHIRIVRTNLLHLDMAHVQHGTNFHDSTAILHYYQISACLASWMPGLVCAFASTWYHACTPFSWEVQCKHTLLVPSQFCLAPLTFSIEGDSSNVISMVDVWMGEWTKDYLVWAWLPHWGKNPRVTPIETLGVFGSPTTKTRWQAEQNSTVLRW